MKLTLFFLGLLLAPPAFPAEPNIVLYGQLQAGDVDTDTPPDLREAVIFFRPTEPVAAPPGEDAVMRMRGKAFEPGVLAVTIGTLVHFPNTDPILHNAFSTSSQSTFDLGFYSAGESRDHLFERPGLVRIYCNVHHGMVGYVMVLDTPFFTKPDVDGRFSLSLPRELTGTLYVWHPQASIIRREIAGMNDTPLDLTVNFTSRRLPRHLNKHGRHYGNRNKRQY